MEKTLSLLKISAHVVIWPFMNFSGHIEFSGNIWPSLGEGGRQEFIHWCSKEEWSEEEKSSWMKTGVWIHDHLLGFHNITFVSRCLLWKNKVPANPHERAAACQDLYRVTFPCLKLLTFLYLPPVWLLSSGTRLEAWDVYLENAANACEPIWILLTRIVTFPRAIARDS